MSMKGGETMSILYLITITHTYGSVRCERKHDSESAGERVLEIIRDEANLMSVHVSAHHESRCYKRLD